MIYEGRLTSGRRQPMARFSLMIPLVLVLASCGQSAPVSEDEPASEGEVVQSLPPVGKPGDIPAPPDVAAPPADAPKTATGLATKVITKGKGTKKPLIHDRVKVHYNGWQTDGKMFDSSVKKGRPASFDVKGVIPGWTEGLQLMVVGEQRRMWIPEAMAYKGRAGPPKGMLVFDVELLEIIPGQAPIPAPADVAAPPADSTKTKSGLAHKIIKPGTGTANPKPSDRVKVIYTGWTTDGVMFDSSLKRGKPAQFTVNKLIESWTEGLQLMVVGEKRLMWIPQELAYKGRPGPPQGHARLRGGATGDHREARRTPPTPGQVTSASVFPRHGRDDLPDYE